MKSLGNLKENYDETVIFVDPTLDWNYVWAIRLDSNNAYSSPKIVGDYMNKPSIYYIPDKYKSCFTNDQMSKEILSNLILSGKRELENYKRIKINICLLY